MLSFTRRQFHDDRLFDLNDLVVGLDQILRQVARPDVALAVHLSPEALRARVDAGQLELSLINLVRNASDATPSGGRIAISTRMDRRTPSVATAVVAVADSGHGMSAEIVFRSVEPFFTTKEPRQGTGLGLSTVNGFAEQSVGTLSIDSQPGRGTTVTLAFPYRDHDLAPRARAPEGAVGYARA